jgi:hypothetical protein
MTFTTYLYERDEHDKLWPAGRFTFDTRKRAISCLEHQVCDGICGMVRSEGFGPIFAFKGMTEREALRVSPVKLLAVSTTCNYT